MWSVSYRGCKNTVFRQMRDAVSALVANNMVSGGELDDGGAASSQSSRRSQTIDNEDASEASPTQWERAQLKSREDMTCTDVGHDVLAASQTHTRDGFGYVQNACSETRSERRRSPCAKRGPRAVQPVHAMLQTSTVVKAAEACVSDGTMQLAAASAELVAAPAENRIEVWHTVGEMPQRQVAMMTQLRRVALTSERRVSFGSSRNGGHDRYSRTKEEKREHRERMQQYEALETLSAKDNKVFFRVMRKANLLADQRNERLRDVMRRYTLTQIDNKISDREVRKGTTLYPHSDEDEETGMGSGDEGNDIHGSINISFRETDQQQLYGTVISIDDYEGWIVCESDGGMAAEYPFYFEGLQYAWWERMQVGDWVYFDEDYDVEEQCWFAYAIDVANDEREDGDGYEDYG